MERAEIPLQYVPKNSNGNTAFRDGVVSKGFYERRLDELWDKLPWYQNEIWHLFKVFGAPDYDPK